MNKLLSILLLISLLCTQSIQAQVLSNQEIDTRNVPVWIDMMQDPTENFFTTQNAFEDYWQGKTITKGDGWKVFKRWEAFMRTRVNIDGMQFPPDYNLIQYQNMMGSNGPLASLAGTWTALGPEVLPTNSTGQPNGVGRVNDIAFHPTNTSTWWIASPSGGLWKTTNSGTTWTPLTDNLPTLGVSSIAIDTSNTNIMYMGTGDRDGGDAPGLGVYKSTNGGLSWTAANTGMGNRVVGKILINPSSPSTLLAATSNGIYKSTNSGASWQLKSSTGNYKDIAFKPNNYNIVYATSASSSGAAFYRSLNGGDTWTQISTGLTNTGVRMVIGVSQNNTNVVYLVAGASNGFSGIYKSTNGGNSFATMSTTPNILGYSATGSDTESQAYYDLAVAVDPSNANTVYVGGINIWKSTNSGASWTINAHWVGTNAPAVHADQHCLVYSPADGALYNGNDGGIYKTTNGGTTWTDYTSGLGISQIYRIGQSASDGNQVIAGFQDNGTALYNSTWSTVIGGDGMECIIDPSNTNYKYGALYYGDVRRSVSGSYYSTIAENGTNGINESGAWITPYCLQENQPGTMFVGYKNIWRSTNVKASSANSVSWTKISTIGTTSSINIIENSPADNAILYIARGSSLFRTDNANANTPTWVTLSTLGSTVSDLEADPTNSNIVYATAGTSVFKSTNKGQSWTSITSNLPTVSINCLVIDTTNTSAIYVGTDLGVFYKDATLSNWINFSSGMPAAIEVTELEIFYSPTLSQSKIRASTYGRGVWTSDLYLNSTSPPIADFTTGNTFPCNGGSVNFTDASIPNPTAWTWSVSPNTVTFVNSTTSSSQNPTIQFNAVGNYSITLIVVNANGIDTITKSNYISVGSTNTVPVIESFQTFTTGNPGTWTNGWTFNNSGVFNWRADNSTTTSANTGPNVDHTLGTTAGIYLYTEASVPAAVGEVANLISPCVTIPSSGTMALTFWYHMYGSDIMGLHVDVLYNGAWVNDIYTLSGQQQTSNNAPWLKATVPLSTYNGSTLKFRFRVIRGANYMGDVAIDDIAIDTLVLLANDEPCGAISLPVGSTCVYTTANNNGATTSIGIPPPGCGGAISQDVWFKAVVPASGSMIIDAEQVAGNFSDGLMAAYLGSCSSMTLLACNDDYNGSGNMPHITLNNQTPGDTVFIRFWKYSGGTGSFDMCISEPPYFLLSPTSNTVSYSLGSSSLNVNASSTVSWSVSDNASWLTLSPATGTGSSVITLNYSTNSGAQRTATITGISAGLPNRIVTFTQQAYINAEFTFASQMVCVGNSTTFTNTSSNATSYKWFINGTQASTVTNYTHTFASAGNYNIKLVAYGSSFSDSTEQTVFVSNAGTSPNAGVDTSLCEGGSLSFNPGINVGAVSCNSNCAIPSYCASHSNADGQEYIINVKLDSTSNASSNLGIGYEDFSQNLFMPILIDSTYNLTVTGFTVGSWPEFVDVFVDWNRNGLFDEPAITLGSATYIGAHNYNGFLTVPNNAALGKTKMRVIMKYGSAPSSGCDNGYGYGETEDYMLDVMKIDVLPHSWTGPASFSSSLVNPSINNITVSQSGTYTLSTTNAFGCSSTDNKIITVNPYPTATFAIINPLCVNGSSISLTQGSPSGGIYSGTGVSAGSFNPSVAGVGTHTITYVYINTSGCSDTATQTVVVNPLPSVSFSGLSPSACISGANLTLTGAPTGGVFTGNGILGNQFNPATAGAGTHAIQYSYTDVNSCSASSSQSILVYSLPIVNAGNNAAISYGTSTTLQAQASGLVGSASYLWSPTSQVVSPNSATTATQNLFVTTSFSVQVTDNTTSCVNSDQVIISINGGPLGLSVGASPDSVCQNDTTQITALASGGVSAISYSWVSNPAGFTSTQSSAQVTPNQTTWYIITISDNTSTLTDSVLVTVMPLPIVNFSMPANVCIDAPLVNLTSMTPAGGLFSGAGVIGNSFYPPSAGIGTHSITYHYMDAFGCSNEKTKAISVNALPTITLSNLNTVCNSSASFTLTNGSPYGGTYSGLGVSGMQFNPIVAGVGTHYITYTFTDQNACTNSDSTQIIVNSSPVANAGTNQQINMNTTANLNGSATGGSGNYSYLWSPASMLSNANISNPVTTSLTTSQLYQLKVSDTQTQCSDSDDVVITIIGGSVTALIQVAQSPICKGDSTILNAIGSGGTGTYTYHWTSSPAYFTSTLQNPKVSPSVTTAFIVSISDGFDSASIGTFVIVDAIPIGQLPTDTGLCVNGQVVLDAGGGYASYQWSNGGSGQTITLLGNSLPLGTTSFYVTITNANGCSTLDSSHVAVSSFPTDLLGPDTNLCETSSLILDAGPNMKSYLWNTGDTTQTIIVDGSMGIGLYDYWVQVTDYYDCDGADGVLINVTSCDAIAELSNEFNLKVYPNPSDGRVQIEVYGEKKDDANLHIFDMQGKLVYQSNMEIRNDKSVSILDLSHLARGMYTLHLRGQYINKVQKLIIQ